MDRTCGETNKGFQSLAFPGADNLGRPGLSDRGNRQGFRRYFSRGERIQVDQSLLYVTGQADIGTIRALLI